MNHAPGRILTEARANPGETPEEAAHAPSSNRRRFPRLASPPEAAVWLQRGVRARLLDLGLGGAFIETSTRLVPGGSTSVKVIAGSVSFQALARVRRAFITGAVPTTPGESTLLYRAGIEFDGLGSTDVHLLQTTLASTGFARTGQRVDQGSAITGVPAGKRSTLSANRLVSCRFPPGWVVTRSESGTAAREPNRRGFVFMRRLPTAPGSDLCEFARTSLREEGFAAIYCRATEINGLRACVGFYQGWLDPLGEVIAEAAVIAVHGQRYLVAGVAAWTAYDVLRQAFFCTISSFVCVTPETNTRA
jgi:hypothetical protein